MFLFDSYFDFQLPWFVFKKIFLINFFYLFFKKGAAIAIIFFFTDIFKFIIVI